MNESTLWKLRDEFAMLHMIAMRYIGNTASTDDCNHAASLCCIHIDKVKNVLCNKLEDKRVRRITLFKLFTTYIKGFDTYIELSYIHPAFNELLFEIEALQEAREMQINHIFVEIMKVLMEG